MISDGKYNKDNNNATVCVITMRPALGKARNLSIILCVTSRDRLYSPHFTDEKLKLRAVDRLSEGTGKS